jgi:hypothetical protein
MLRPVGSSTTPSNFCQVTKRPISQAYNLDKNFFENHYTSMCKERTASHRRYLLPEISGILQREEMLTDKQLPTFWRLLLKKAPSSSETSVPYLQKYTPPYARRH